MPKWILLTVLATAFACERDRGTEGTEGAVGAERDGSELGQDTRELGRDIEQGAERGAEGVEEGARDLGEGAEREWEEHNVQGEQGQQQGAQQGQGQQGAQGQAGAQNSQLQQQVKQSLDDADLSTSVENIQVMATRDGKVTLQGNVASEQERSRIGELVRQTSGVTEVDNKLQVSGQ